MKNYNLKITLLIIALVISVSCSKKIDLVNPNGLTVDTFNKNTDELTKSVNSIYAVLQAPGIIGRQWGLLQEMRGNDSKPGGGQLDGYLKQILTGSHDASNTILTDVWPTLYVLILRANTVIESAPHAAGDERLKSRLVGEAKFLRAWAYFQLATLWGPVPLYKTVPKSPIETAPRSSVDEVYNFAIQDLIEAEEVLEASYGGGDLGRASKGAAQTLQGCIHLQRLEYLKAREQFQKVIDSKLYKLTPEYKDNFMEETEFNQESIFEVGFQYTNNNYGWGNNTGDGLLEVGESTMRNQDLSPIAWRNYIPSDWLLKEYENQLAGDPKTDPRLHDNVYFPGDLYNNGKDTLKASDQNGDTTEYYGNFIKASWKKYTITYKSNAGYYAGGINYRMFRYGMVLLMMAECEAGLNNLGTAISYLNEVRDRPSVSMPPYPTSKFPCQSKEEVFAAIMHEKAVETAGEQLRNFDLLRWRKAGHLKEEVIPNYSEKLALLPIPQQEMANNPRIGAQNPGY